MTFEPTDLLGYLTKVYNDTAKGAGVVTLHFRVGASLYLAFMAKITGLQRERPEALIAVTNPSGHMMFKSGTLRLDSNLSAWGYVCEVERRIPAEFRQ